jgi:hypothetical protein
MAQDKRHIITGFVLFLAAVGLSLLSGVRFMKMRGEEHIYPSEHLSSKKRLCSYFQDLEGTAGDTDVFVYKGEEEGGNLLILGGTHPNEPAGFITAFILVENIRVLRGKVVIVPRANSSGFSHNDPQEASPQHFALETSGGPRLFRSGSRLTNPVHQWPDPVLYINPAGQKLSGNETRNLNRCYPGKEKGNLTEKIAHGIMELIREEEIHLGIDLHEAAPEYPVINAIVFNENSAELAALSQMELQLEGYELRLEASPPNLRGLSHREWGEVAGVQAILLETTSASQGRLKGKTSASLITEGKDKNYTKAAKLGHLFVPYPEEGIPLRTRVARHLASIKVFVKSLTELNPERSIDIAHLPPPFDVEKLGIGAFLKPPKGR